MNIKISKRLYVISDLHIGGEYPGNLSLEELLKLDPKEQYKNDRGFRICTNVPKLVEFIMHIDAEGSREKIETELVINGDFVDFLAEKWTEAAPWRPFIDDPKEAAERLEIIIKRDQPLFDALRDFLASGHELTIMLGNHDIELSFPQVREVLHKALETHRKHFKFIYDNEAYVVGKVLIEHGNRYDGFNMIDHHTLRALRSNHSRSESPREKTRLTPPPGSRLVAEIMNNIKKRFTFIDLLKPEIEAVIPLLLTLAPEYREFIFDILKHKVIATLNNPLSDGQPRFTAKIKTKHTSNNSEDSLKEFLETKNIFEEESELFIQEINASLISDDKSSDEVNYKKISFSKKKENVLIGSAYLSLLTVNKEKPLTSRLNALRTALKVLNTDKSFLINEEDNLYLDKAKGLLDAGYYEVIIFGHTHLAKERQVDQNKYINTGTWADLMIFPMKLLEKDDNALLEFVINIESNEFNKENYIKFFPTYAQIDFSINGEILDKNLKCFEYSGLISNLYKNYE